MGVNLVVRIANRWSRLSRVGLRAGLYERGANPRQGVAVRDVSELQIRVGAGLKYKQIHNTLEYLEKKLLSGIA